MTVQHRRIGSFKVSPIGFGCMSLSHAFGPPPPPEAQERVLLKALDLGTDYFDTAALYGAGANEELVGRVLKPYRSRFMLGSKCGMGNVNGKRVIDGRPEVLKRTCEDSLRRLQTDVIDLYYLHRMDRNVPIEDSVGALADLVREGKIRSIGLSEVSAQTLRKAHAVHPIAALQSEYSLLTRNAEIAALDACKSLGVTLVAFSPVGRGLLTGKVRDAEALHPTDIRRNMPRFVGDAFKANLALLDEYAAIARDAGCTMAQLALAWLLTRGEHVVPIPGTTNIAHLEENMGAAPVKLDAKTLARLDQLINQRTVTGSRYSPALQADVDTEEF